MAANLSEVEVQRWWDEIERLARVLGQVGPDEVCCGGLTPRQCAILRTLVAQEGARISELAARSGITPSAMTRVLEKLEAHKLVERARGTHDDGRAASVRITVAGREIRRQLDVLMRQRTRAIMAAIAPERRQEVLNTLQLLNDGITSAECCALNEPVEPADLQIANSNPNGPSPNEPGADEPGTIHASRSTRRRRPRARHKRRHNRKESR